MMAIFGAIIPRFALLVGWYNDQTFWTNLYGSPFLFLLGFLFLPWTTLMYVLVAGGGITGGDWFWMALALFADIGSYAGGALGGRGRVPGYS